MSTSTVSVGPRILMLPLALAQASWAITIDIDYSLDARSEFFNTQQKRHALEAAAERF